MFTQFDTFDPAKRLALTYAKTESRDALTLFLTLDTRLAQIWMKGTEPLIGQMRMAWWRDALLKPVSQRPKGEPLFLDMTLLSRDFSASMIHLVDAWYGLLVHEEWTADVLTAFAMHRSQGIFGGYAQAVALDDNITEKLVEIGLRWAMRDALQYCKTVEQAELMHSCLPPRSVYTGLPRAARPLSLLALSAEQTRGGMAPGIRLLWHGLTGR